MRFSILLLALGMTSAVTARGNKTTGTSIKAQCHEMAKLEKTVATAANTTKLTNKFDGNATKISEYEAKASVAATELATMQSNTTLLAACAVETEKEDCKEMAKLQKKIDTAANSTKLDEKFDGNATKIAEYQAKAAEAQTKLDAMTSNTTLVDACTALTTAETSTNGSTTTAAAAESSSSSTSGAALNFGSGPLVVLSTALTVAAGLMML